MIAFNKIHLTDNELDYMNDAMRGGKISGDGPYTKRCELFFEKKYGFEKVLLTSSCTDALELAALLIDLKPGDEVIMPSYSFVSMANAFILRGVKIIFADSGPDNPNIDAGKVEALITIYTKAIVVVHYGGIACNIGLLKEIAGRHNLYLIEDAAHAIDCFYNGRPLGSFGHLATFSFHETKNITCGEGGLLVINDKKLINRAEVMREKGTNQSSFSRREVANYSWVDVGSSFLASDITAAFLYAQLNELEDIQEKRREIWSRYYSGLEQLENENSVKLPHVPAGAIHNGHVFYLVCKSPTIRDAYIDHMLSNQVQVRFHYITLHDSPYYKKMHGKRVLPLTKVYQDCLVRLPLFYGLKKKEVDKIISLTCKFFLQQDLITIR
jgi:dTDP-4-amino-4,6-dideoxygalactose transaminase